MEEGEYFSEHATKMRDPLLYFMYIGRFKRNGGSYGAPGTIADLTFRRLDEEDFNESLA